MPSHSTLSYGFSIICISAYTKLPYKLQRERVRFSYFTTCSPALGNVAITVMNTATWNSERTLQECLEISIVNWIFREAVTELKPNIEVNDVHDPAGKQHGNDIVLTSMRRIDVASMSM